PGCVEFFPPQHAPALPAAVHSVSRGWETLKRNGIDNPASNAQSALERVLARECLHGASYQTTCQEFPTSATHHLTCRCVSEHLPANCRVGSASSFGSEVPCRRNQ